MLSWFGSVFTNALGAVAGFFLAGLLLKDADPMVVAAIGAVFLGPIFYQFVSRKIIKTTEDSLSGPKRSPGRAILLWLVMFVVLAAALIIYGLSQR